jgi:hypothetical protein
MSLINNNPYIDGQYYASFDAIHYCHYIDDTNYLPCCKYSTNYINYCDTHVNLDRNIKSDIGFHYQFIIQTTTSLINKFNIKSSQKNKILYIRKVYDYILENKWFLAQDNCKIYCETVKNKLFEFKDDIKPHNLKYMDIDYYIKHICPTLYGILSDDDMPIKKSDDESLDVLADTNIIIKSSDNNSLKKKKNNKINSKQATNEILEIDKNVIIDI